MAIVLLVMVVVRAVFALDYSSKMSQVLDRIEMIDYSNAVCISPDLTKPKKLPFINLGQDETFAEWALPYMLVYGKHIAIYGSSDSYADMCPRDEVIEVK